MIMIKLAIKVTNRIPHVTPAATGTCQEDYVIPILLYFTYNTSRICNWYLKCRNGRCWQYTAAYCYLARIIIIFKTIRFLKKIIIPADGMDSSGIIRLFATAVGIADFCDDNVLIVFTVVEVTTAVVTVVDGSLQ